MERRWISVRECSLYLGLHEKTVYRLLDKGQVPGARIGGSVRIDKKRLDQIMGIDDLSEKLGLK